MKVFALYVCFICFIGYAAGSVFQTSLKLLMGSAAYSEEADPAPIETVIAQRVPENP
jgi:hypothetical protein